MSNKADCITAPATPGLLKIYNKQKEAIGKGDWYEILLTDFVFIGEVKNDEIIMKIDKLEYKKNSQKKG